MGHDNNPHSPPIQLVVSLDPALQDLVNAIYLDLQALRLTPADVAALDEILATTKALLAKAQAISTVPPIPKQE